MKQIKHIYLLLFFIVFNIEISISQKLEFGINANLGLSQVTNFPNPKNYDKISSFSYKLGCRVERSINDKSKLGIGIDWLQIKNRDIKKDATLYLAQAVGVGDSIGIADITNKLKNQYIGVLIYYNYEIKKFDISGGVEPLVLIHSSEFENYDGILRGKQVNEDVELGRDKIEGFDIGLFTAIGYKLNKRFKVNLEFYIGLNDIQKDRRGRKNNIRQLTLGIGYLLKT